MNLHIWNIWTLENKQLATCKKNHPISLSYQIPFLISKITLTLSFKKYELTWLVWELDLCSRNHFTSRQWFFMKNKIVQAIAWKWVLSQRWGFQAYLCSSPNNEKRSQMQEAASYKALSPGWEHHEKSKEAWDLQISPYMLSSITARSKPLLITDATLVPGFGPEDPVK